MYYRIYRLKIKKSSMIIPSISHCSGYTVYGVYGNPTDATSARSPPVGFFPLRPYGLPGAPVASVAASQPETKAWGSSGWIGMRVNLCQHVPGFPTIFSNICQSDTMNHIITVMILSTWLWLSSCMDKVAADGMLLVCHGKGSIHRTLSYGDIWGCSFSLWCGKWYCPRIRWRQKCGQTETSYHGVCIYCI